jgi:hypothetical protein
MNKERYIQLASALLTVVLLVLAYLQNAGIRL